MRYLPKWTSLAAVAAITLAAALGSPGLPATPARAAAAEPLDPDVVAQAQAKLAWRLIESVAPSGGNRIVSPASLASAFWVLSLGADGPMKSAILKALDLRAADAAHAEEVLASARDLLAKGAPSLLQSADYVVFAPGDKPWKWTSDFLKREGVENSVMDLSQAEAVKTLDGWVASKTGGLIPELIGKPLDRPAFVILNALHFKARWKEPFDPAATSQAPFQDGERGADKVMLMKLPASTRAYRLEKGFVGVELPFSDERFALVVVTSTDKPKLLKDFASVAGWLSASGFAPTQGDLALPRFSVEGGGDLAPALKNDLAPGLASPTALAGFGAGSKIQGVLQRAKIEANEEGAEAAAATAVIVGRSLTVDDKVVHMIVDKPFLFALRDRKSGLILAAGYVGKAPKAKG